jgi:hypothetical protein
MKLLKMTFVLSALAFLGGCIAVPVNSGYYDAAPAYGPPAPVVYGPPVIYGPTIGFGLYGGGRGYGGGYGRGYGGGYGHR